MLCTRPVRDPYAVLEVPKDADADQIKAAFRRLALIHHPDRNQGDPGAQERFKELNQAYQVLSDPQKRAAYDRYGAKAFETGGGPADLNFAEFEELFGDLLGVFGVRTGERGDLQKVLQLSFEEAALGCERDVEYERMDTCMTCGGRGAEPGTAVEACRKCEGTGRQRLATPLIPIAMERACGECRGFGKVPRVRCKTCGGQGVAPISRTLSVEIPAGIENGATRTVVEAGHRLRPDRTPGNLLIVIEVLPHPYFRRVGDDLVCGAPVSFSQAALGGEIEVMSLSGKVRVRVPSGTQPGSVLRIRGKGFHHRRAGRGDQLVEVNVEIPTHLSERARSIIAELGRELTSEPESDNSGLLARLKNLFS